MPHTDKSEKPTNPECNAPIMSTINHSHLRLLAIFATVIESGSFAAAARKLNTSRSRISEQVSSLESDLGTRLLQRSTRQLTITSEGEQVYAQVAQLADILREVEAITTPQVPSGRVAITMGHDIAHKYVLSVIEGFKQAYPHIQLDLILDDTRRDLIADQIDLGIRIGFPKDDSLVARILHEERFALFASPAYLAKNGIPDTIHALSQRCWVTLLQTSHSGIQRLRQHNQAVEITPADTYRCNSPLLAQQMVIQGLGIGMLLPNTVREEVSKGELIQLMPTLRSDPLVFALVYPSRRHVPLRTRVVIDYLLKADMFGQRDEQRGMPLK